MRFTSAIVVLMFCFQVAAKQQTPEEITIINGLPLNSDRCVHNTAQQCKEEREARVEQGCISVEAERALAKKKKGHLVVGGFPVCNYKNELLKWCYCGCFHPDTRLLAYDKNQGMVRYETAATIITDPSRFDLMTLDDESNLKRISLGALSIVKHTQAPEKDALVILDLSNGNTLKISSQHAVMLSSGKMVAAEELIEGFELVGEDANPVRINSVKREMTSEQVINFMTTGDSVLKHMLIAEGVVVGDLQWQNDFVVLLGMEMLE